MGHINCKSLFKIRGEAAVQECFMEVARQEMEQRRMTGVPGSLDTTHEALALCLSARKPALVPLARGGQV